ncbi:Hydrophobe/amphiphile efflux-1 HAE1 precursor [gamma proteobacterium HdN1]|nr:Hydrophobe/amphiphile efflux-1 HAE1 precursor [gamma proteobacterium HdN1]
MLPQFFISRPIFAWVIALAIVLGGALSIRYLPVEQYPEVAPPTIIITATYPGASAQVLEETVTNLIEQEMNGIDHLLYMESTSDSNGILNTLLTFRSGTSLDLSSVEVQNRIKRVEARLPEEVRRQGITVAKYRRNFMLILAFFSPDKSLDGTAIGSFVASNVLDNIRRVRGVGEAMLLGTEYSMRIWLNTYKLAEFNLSPAEVLRIVRAQNVQLATGELGALPSRPGQEIAATVLTQGRLKTPEEFGNIIIRANPDGATVYLKDIARIELGPQDYLLRTRYNGQPATALGIKLAPGENALDTSRRVHERLTELGEGFPASIGWVIPYDTSRFVEISIREVIKTLTEAFILVFLVMWLFLGSFRTAMIPALVVPVSLFGTLCGLYLLGYSINVLTLFAMVLAIGVVVDDAIVVVENVERIMREEKLAPLPATRKAMKQVIGAIIGITVILCSVFLPMAFFGGSVGAIYQQFSVTLVLTMGFSALMAMTLSPALCATLLRPHQDHRGFLAWFNDRFTGFNHRYGHWMQWMVVRPARFLVVYLAIAAIAIVLFLRLPSGFLPDEDQGYLISVVQMPAGATQERTLKVLGQLEQYFLQQEEVGGIVSIAGFSFLGRGQDAAIAFTRLKSWDERKDPNQHALSVMQRANRALFGIKQAFMFVVNPPPIPELAALGGFDFRMVDEGVVGRDKLNEARGIALALAAKDPRLAGVRFEGKESGTQMMLDIDRLRAQTLGIDIGDLNDTLSISLGSAYVNDFYREGRALRVNLQLDPESRATPEDILAIRVKTRNGTLVPLSEIAQMRWIVGSPRLDRYNGMPVMKLAGNPSPGHSTGEAMQAMEEIATHLPPGIGFEWSSTSMEEKLAAAQTPLLFTFSILAVFMCLAALYESWSVPFAVLLMVPMGLFGAVLAVVFREMPNDVYFKVGIVTIIGLSAKNSILIVEFARQLEEAGHSALEAAVEAAKLRLRPIIMTSFAFVFGVMPLVFSTGAGASSRHAIGTGVMGGMIAATVLAVLLVPVLYVVIRKLFPGGLGHHEEESGTQASENPEQGV